MDWSYVRFLALLGSIGFVLSIVAFVFGGVEQAATLVIANIVGLIVAAIVEIAIGDN